MGIILYNVVIWTIDAVMYSIKAYNSFKNNRVIKTIIEAGIVILSMFVLLGSAIPQLIEAFKESKKKKECK